jgi:hypothetical protein
MKCNICKNTIEKTFLNKPIGTYIKNKNSKKKLICNNCQKSYSKEELLNKL